MDSINSKPPLTTEQEREFDRLDAMGEQNALEIRHHLGVVAAEEIREEAETQESKEAKLHPPRKAKTAREKAWADTRPDLRPFPYGTRDSF